MRSKTSTGMIACMAKRTPPSGRASDAIRNTDIATGHSTHDQPQQGADQSTG
jgi:hypothetical protein